MWIGASRSRYQQQFRNSRTAGKLVHGSYDFFAWIPWFDLLFDAG